MIRTIITPLNTDLHIDLPIDYIGKQLEVLVFATDETNKVNGKAKNKPGVMAQFWGVISKETGEEMHKHIEQSRSEWERDI